MADSPQFEIDHGPPTTGRKTRSAPPPPDAVSSADLDDEALLRERIPAAQAQVAAAAMGVNIAQMAGLVLIFLCGQALGILGRMDNWNTGVYVGLLLAVVGMGAAGWLTLLTRSPGAELGQIPVPDVDPPKRTGPMTGTQRIAQHQRRRDEVDLILALGEEFARLRRVLTLSAAGALLGSVCAWIIGGAGSTGSIPLCATAASLAGFAVGWRLAHGPGKGVLDFAGDPAEPWPHVVVERLIVGVLPGAALLMALVIGCPIVWSLGLWLVTAVIVFVLRIRLVAYGVKAGLNVAPLDDELGAFAEEDPEDDDGEEDADAEVDEEDIDSSDDDEKDGKDDDDRRPSTAPRKH